MNKEIVIKINNVKIYIDYYEDKKEVAYCLKRNKKSLKTVYVPEEMKDEVKMYIYIPEDTVVVDHFTALKRSLNNSKYEVSHFKQVGRMQKKNKKWKDL